VQGAEAANAFDLVCAPAPISAAVPSASLRTVAFQSSCWLPRSLAPALLTTSTANRGFFWRIGNDRACQVNLVPISFCELAAVSDRYLPAQFCTFSVTTGCLHHTGMQHAVAQLSSKHVVTRVFDSDYQAFHLR
jgi:hypothetical protein